MSTPITVRAPRTSRRRTPQRETEITIIVEVGAYLKVCASSTHSTPKAIDPVWSVINNRTNPPTILATDQTRPAAIHLAVTFAKEYEADIHS